MDAQYQVPKSHDLRRRVFPQLLFESGCFASLARLDHWLKAPSIGLSYLQYLCLDFLMC